MRGGAPRGAAGGEPDAAPHAARPAQAGLAPPVCDYAKAVQRWSSATHAADESVPEWRPYQLRSACGTRVRAWFGLEAARAVLGHSMRGGVTDRYTREAMERETIRTAERAALALG